MSRVSFRDPKRVSVYAEHRYRGQLQSRISKWEISLISRILQRINAKGATVLDIPCGYGRFAGTILNAGANLIAADISKDMVLETAKATGSGHFLVADGAHLPFADKSIDVTFTIRLLQHLAHRELRIKILSELRRVARQFVIVSFYDREGLHSLQRMIKRKSRRTRKFIDFRTRFQFHEEAETAGLRVVDLFPVRRIFHAQVLALLAPA